MEEEMKTPETASTDPDELQHQFVFQVEKHLEKKGTMAKDMCEKAGLSHAHWSNIKSHWKRLTLDKMGAIAKACGKKITITLS